MTLLDNGWTDEADSRASPQPEPRRWNSQVETGTPPKVAILVRQVRKRTQTPCDGQLEFVAYELCNTYEGVGMALKHTKTVEAAREAVEPL